jgi:hypothetical protein
MNAIAKRAPVRPPSRAERVVGGEAVISDFVVPEEVGATLDRL